MNTESNEKLNDKTAIIPPPFKINGSKFVVVFIVVSAAIAVMFCYGMYQSFLTRPKVQIQDEKE